MGIGTYKYMAPEMMVGMEGYEIGKMPMKPVDIYAFGMVLVALVTEEEPYPKMKNDRSIPFSVADKKLSPKLQEDLKETKCPPMFFKLTNRCVDNDQKKRPTAKEIVKELDEMKEKVINFKSESESKRNVIKL